MRQIAALTGASRTAILDSLKRFKIPVRERGKALNNQASLPFGKRRVNGKIISYQAEARVIASIKKMRDFIDGSHAISRKRSHPISSVRSHFGA